MKVLKIEAEGITTSFRYPHFMQGVQPTFEMPPPATIYGHICSALGDWVDPSGIEFAYHFTYEAKFDDVEHVHLLSPAEGGRKKREFALVGKINPYKRAILFKPRLVLYLNRPEWEEAFKSPFYPVVLGRSQDLFTYKRVRVIELATAKQAYFGHTLAPYRLALQTGSGYAVLMPQLLNYGHRRTPTFARYIVLPRRVYSTELLKYDGTATPSYQVDPESAVENGMQLGLFFHAFVGGGDDIPFVAGMA